jgi:acetylornithine deacetylase
LPGESGADAEREIAALLPAGATQRTLLVREPFEAAPGSDVVAALLAARGGGGPVGVSYWADAAFIAAAGIPTALFGPAGAGAHATEEWVSIASTVTVTETLIAAGRRLCA